MLPWPPEARPCTRGLYQFSGSKALSGCHPSGPPRVLQCSPEPSPCQDNAGPFPAPIAGHRGSWGRKRLRGQREGGELGAAAGAGETSLPTSDPSRKRKPLARPSLGASKGPSSPRRSCPENSRELLLVGVLVRVPRSALGPPAQAQEGRPSWCASAQPVRLRRGHSTQARGQEAAGGPLVPPDPPRGEQPCLRPPPHVIWWEFGRK